MTYLFLVNNQIFGYNSRTIKNKLDVYYFVYEPM